MLALHSFIYQLTEYNHQASKAEVVYSVPQNSIFVTLKK